MLVFRSLGESLFLGLGISGIWDLLKTSPIPEFATQHVPQMIHKHITLAKQRSGISSSLLGIFLFQGFVPHSF